MNFNFSRMGNIVSAVLRRGKIRTNDRRRLCIFSNRRIFLTAVLFLHAYMKIILPFFPPSLFSLPLKYLLNSLVKLRMRQPAC